MEIVDYKTGSKTLSQKEADDNLQLSIYALAATSIPDAPFARAPGKVKLSLHYFDPPQTVTTMRTRQDLKKAREIVIDYKKQIESSDFKCSGSFLCKNCEYSLMCRVDS